MTCGPWRWGLFRVFGLGVEMWEARRWREGDVVWSDFELVLVVGGDGAAA